MKGTFLKRALGFLATLLIAAGIAHLATIYAFPSFAMGRAMERLTTGASANVMRAGPPVTAESRAVVAPSPDLLYSSCVYDLWRGPVAITVAPVAGYWSLSVYDARSNAHAVFNDREHPQGVTVTLVRSGAAPPPGAGVVVESATRRGIALVRREASTPEALAAAQAAQRGDACQAFVR
jgi:uncharacterized membrane protein